MTRYKSLQSLRAVAALLVVYYHAVLAIQPALGRPDTSLPVFGAAGVDLFFVISGFVVWTSTAGRKMTPLAFYGRRLARIVPLYWAVTLAVCAIAIAAPQLLRSTKFALNHALASLLFVPWANPGLPPGDPDLLSPVVIPGWTLNYEMFFYLLFGGALMAAERHRPLVIAALIFLSMLFAHLLLPALPTLSFYASTMSLEFLAGVLIAVFVARWRPRLRRLWPVASIALLIALCLVDASNLHLDRALRLGALAALLVFAAVAAERAGTAPRAALLDHLGDASYSIYLLHIFIIAGLREMIRALGLSITGPGGELLFIAAAMTSSAVIGVAVYRWFERPASRATARLLLPAKSAPVLATGVR